MLADFHPTVVVGEVHDASEVGFGKLDSTSDGIFGCHNGFLFYLVDTKGARMFSTSSLANRSLEYFS